MLWTSPLDAMDAYARFTGVLTSASSFPISPSLASLTSTTRTALETSSPQLFQLATQLLDQSQRAELEEIGARTLRGGEKADAVQPVQ